MVQVSKKIDPRIIVFFNNFTLLIVGVLLWDLQRSYEQIIFAFACGVPVELICARSFNKYKKSNSIDRLMTAVTITAGTLLLINSYAWWFHGLAASVAIILKYTLLVNNHHVFNPITSAIVLSFAFFPNTTLALYPNEFWFHGYTMFQVVILGLVATTLAGTFFVTFSYFIMVAFWAFFFSFLSNQSFFAFFGPDLGLTGVLFAFFMITDPKTAPKKIRGQILYVLAISFVTATYRLNHILYSNFLALFTINGLAPFFKSFCERFLHGFDLHTHKKWKGSFF